MRPHPVLCLQVALFFAFSVLAPLPAEAAERTRGSQTIVDAVDDVQANENGLLQELHESLKADRQQTQIDLRNVRAALRADWQQTRQNVLGIELKMVEMRQNIAKKGLFGFNPIAKLRQGLLKRASDAIDELGVEGFRAKVREVAGVDLVPDAPEGASEQLVHGLLMRTIETTFDEVADELSHGSQADIEAALDEAEGVIGQIQKGAEPETVAAGLKERHMADLPGEGEKASTTFKSVFKAVFRVARTLFFVAALGAVGMVSLGFLAAAITGESLVFSAVGGAALIACLVGIVKYIRDCIKQFGKKASEIFAEPALASEVAR